MICALGAKIEGPQNNSKIERGYTVYLGGLVIITHTAGHAALLLPLVGTASPVVFEEVVSPSDA